MALILFDPRVLSTDGVHSPGRLLPVLEGHKCPTAHPFSNHWLYPFRGTPVKCANNLAAQSYNQGNGNVVVILRAISSNLHSQAFGQWLCIMIPSVLRFQLRRACRIFQSLPASFPGHHYASHGGDDLPVHGSACRLSTMHLARLYTLALLPRSFVSQGCILNFTRKRDKYQVLSGLTIVDSNE